MVQLSHPYITNGKTIVLTIWTFVDKVMSLLFNILSKFAIAFLPRRKEKTKVLVAQSGPSLCDPMDCSLPGSSAHGIFQARVLEWGAIVFSKIMLIFRKLTG